MAKVPPISSAWIPEDDLLLKNSIEAGASLEALAKGAVRFSRRFTFRELQDRWHSLLYDPDISAQASSRMVELELFGSIPSSKFSRLYNSKGNEKVHEKRKGGSIRGQYYAMRKRIRSEFYDSPHLGFLDERNLPNCNEHGHDFQEHVPLNNEDQCGDSMIGDCLVNNLGLQETDLEILRRAFPETIGDISTTSAVDNTGTGFRTGFQNAVEDNNPNSIVRKDGLYGFSEDVSPLIRKGVRGSFEPKMEPKDGSHMLEGGSNGFAKCMGLHEIGPSHTPKVKLFETGESHAKQVSTYDSVNDNNHILCSGFGGKQHFSSPGSDGSASFHALGFSSPLPRLPLWKTMEDVSAPDMPVDGNNGDVPQGAEETLTLPDDSDCRRETTAGYDDIHSTSLLRDRPDGSEFISTHAGSEGEFTDLPDSLLNFSNEDELLFMDVDGKDSMDKSCDDNLNSLLVGSPKEVRDGDLCKVESKTSFVSNACLAAPGVPCPAESEDIASSVHGDQKSDYQVDVNVPSRSVLNSESLQLSEGKINCILNTEDPEIPCNDDIFLLIHPGTSFASSARQPLTTDSIDPTSSSADEKDGEQGLNLMNKGKDPASSFTWSQMVGPNVLPESVSGHQLVGCAAKSELPEAKSPVLRPRLPNKCIRDSYQSRSVHAAPVTTVDGVLEEDLTKVEPRAVDTPAMYSERPLHAEAGSVKLTIPESIANPSTSDKDECESDGDIPYFSDIEAMILEMDLAYDQDSCISRQVARYQYEDTKRTIIRLEQTARSSLQRAMTSKGALAILYGRHLKHYIKKTEVTLGRSTDDTDIDIDLRKEGRANKISRRQATIKMETDGSFSLKNLGKSSISVNGKVIANGQEFTLSSSCLIEIRGMSFVFEINHKYLRWYLDNLIKQSQGKSSHFEWSPEGEP